MMPFLLLALCPVGALPDSAPDIRAQKDAVLDAMERGDLRRSIRALDQLVKLDSAPCAPAIDDIWNEGLRRLSRLRREKAKLERELEKYKTIRDPKTRRKIKGDYPKWREVRQRYDPVVAEIYATGGTLPYAVRVLFELGSPEAAEGLARLLRTGTGWLPRARAADRLGDLDAEIALETLLQASTMKTAGILVGVALGLGKKAADSEKAREALAALTDNTYWQVRLAAARGLAASGDRAMTFTLINMLAVEKGRMRWEINEGLKKLTGIDKNGDYGAWKEWWDRNREAFLAGTYTPRAAERADRRGQTSFYGLPFNSTDVLFILDASGTMTRLAQWSPEEDDPTEVPDGNTRLDIARFELRKIVNRLPDRARYNLLVMGDETDRLSSSMTLASRRTLSKSVRFINKLELRGGTNIWNAFTTALEHAGGRWYDPLDKDSVDTIYFISDGVPNTGVKDRRDLACRIVEALRYRMIVVHSIGISPPVDGAMVLRPVAQELGGEYVVR